MSTLALVVIGKNKAECAGFDLESVRSVVDELVFIGNPGAIFGGLGKIGNRFLATSGADVVGVVHADTVFGPGTAASCACAALERQAVTGLVGRAFDGSYVWCRDIEAPQRVSTLDGCAVFVPRAVCPELRFDAETFDNFHCCVEDLCLSAQFEYGLTVLVAPGPGDHLGTNWQKIGWMRDYTAYRAKLRQKWAGRWFATT